MSGLFKKAERKKSKLRLALFAPSGGGKTYTALSIATGIAEKSGGKVGLIDSERGSASKYAEGFGFSFDVAELTKFNVDSYVQCINDASGVFDVLIIDSLTHAWQDLLQEIDAIAKAKYRGNTWSAWSEGTPKQKKLVDAILNFNGHIIATMRVKTEWVTEKDDRGRNRPVKLGLSPEQGKGIEYEFDTLIEMNTDNVATATKDRTGLFQGRIIDKPSKEIGHELYNWLNSGVDYDKIVNKALPEVTKCNTIEELGALHKKYEQINTEKRFLSALSERKKEIKQGESDKFVQSLINKLENVELTPVNVASLMSDGKIKLTPEQKAKLTELKSLDSERYEQVVEKVKSGEWVAEQAAQFTLTEEQIVGINSLAADLPE